MSSDPTRIVAVAETIYFSHHGDSLRQWIVATIENRSAAPQPATATITAGGEQVATDLVLASGVREYRCFAPVLWPDRPAEMAAPLTISQSGRIVAESVASVGHHRPWTLYVLSDCCTDYAWVYDSELEFRSDDAAITEAEMMVAESQAGVELANANHYNLVHARQVEYYVEHHPEHAERLFAAIRENTIQYNPFFNMFATNDVTLEEMIRHFYPARTWAVEHDLDMGYGNHQETPTISWGMATVLAGAGVRHLVKSVLPYECPWAKRLAEPPIFVWEGPDGSQILVRRRNEDYVEAHWVINDLRATNTALHSDKIPYYEGLGAAYPFDAIGLVGVYGDLAPRLRMHAAKKTAVIAEYNAQGWEYPRLVNAAHKQFWDDIDRQIAERQIVLPVYRGDYGHGWDSWPACLAHDFAGWRRAQERALTADHLTAIASSLSQLRYAAMAENLTDGWLNLISLHDHAWNGANDANRVANAAFRRRWQVKANAAFDAVVDEGLGALADRVTSGDGEGILVFNRLGWERAGIVRADGLAPAVRITDTASGQAVVTQVVEENGRQSVYFAADAVPSVGYRTYTWEAGTVVEEPGPWIRGENRLEGPHYVVEVSPVTGGIVRLFDKTRGVELADPASAYHINQCLYLSEDVEHTPHAATVEFGASGPLFAQLIVTAQLKNTTVVSTITLYATLDRVDICNELEKEPTSERQELDFAFPFHVPDCQVRYELPGAIVTPGVDHLPGSGLNVYTVRHFVDLFNDEHGVTLSQADSGLFELGRRTTWEDPQEPVLPHSTVLALAMENTIDWNEAIRDQAGVRHFTYRYSIQGHAGGFDPVRALRFGWEDNNPLEATPLPTQQRGPLPSGTHSFLSVSPDNVIVVGFKPAEEEGLIVRLWECAGRATEAQLALGGLGELEGAYCTGLLELDAAPLDVHGDNVQVLVAARGIATVRLLL